MTIAAHHCLYFVGYMYIPSTEHLDKHRDIDIMMNLQILAYFMLKYPLRCTPDGVAGVHVSGHFNRQGC